jgi:hypothetical protein
VAHFGRNEWHILNRFTQEATGNGDCGTGYMYFCGYFYGIDHPEFYAYEGPWLA